MKRWGAVLFWLMASLATSVPATYTYVPSAVQPPAPMRELRGGWVATIGNIDWPSKPGLSTEQQKAELIAIFDRAAYVRLNAVILQVRPSCDAFYASRLEPWSEYITGQMGQPPNPPYDPLAFAVEEAHRRGLELHAWFNPYRARTPSARSSVASNHISKVHPEMVKSYNGYQWLDPGDKKVQEYILRVILDVVKRYDIDAVHIDDYFYPPQQKNVFGKVQPFPDWGSWRRYQSSGGKLNREDWRRENINHLVERLYEQIKSEKKYVKLGISPAGIWRPGNPPQIRGFDPYAQIYADSRKWLVNGWVDYFAPQLYWEIQAPAQSYPVLLKWWTEQNVKQRHLWPGNAVSRLGSGRPASEILNQVRLTREQSGATGNIFWNFKPLLENQANIAERLRSEIYTQPALPPASTWLESAAPERPALSVLPGAASKIQLSWRGSALQKSWLWVLQTRTASGWTTEILPAQRNSHTVPASASLEAVSLTAVDRYGNASAPCVLEKQQVAAR